MAENTRVNFHCHSDVSDGVYSPETLAELLARDGVRYAALTDHDTVDGWARFADVLEQRGVGCISGVEISARWGSNEIHLLGYGFNPINPELRHVLHTIRKHRRIGLQTVLSSLRTTLKGRPPQESQTDPDLENQRPLPPYDCAEIIRRIHDAGGLVFLAHPFTVSSDPEEIARTVKQLKALGLDGLETYCPDYNPEQRGCLVDLAREDNLYLSGGTDLHGPNDTGQIQTGVDVPTRVWKDFRNALRQVAPPRPDSAPVTRNPSVLRWKQLAFRIVLPVLLTIGLFLFANFAILIPGIEDRLMERKREMARELNAVAVSLMEEYVREEQSGTMSREEAQHAAVQRIRQLRYGPQGKDYFWIIDTQPAMVMHPYRHDLEGTDLSMFADEHGKRLFVESVNKAERNGEGFVDYSWQWQDDPSRIESKESHVRLFKPWNWVIGTGIYLDDVREEIAQLTRHLVWSVVLISVLVSGLLLFVMQQSLRLERQRGRAEAALRESHKKYRLLVETATEGTLLLLDGRCAFANRAMLDLLGYAPQEILLLEWHDLVPENQPEVDSGTRHLTDLMEGRPAPLEYTGQIRHKNGDLITVSLSCQSIDIDDRHGVILTTRSAGGAEPAISGGPDPRQQALLEELQTSLLFLNEPLDRFQWSMLACPLDTTIAEAARLMNRQGSDAILVLSESGQPIGIVTDGDLRQRVLAKGMNTNRPVHQIMSSPLIGIDRYALAHQALLHMDESHVHHLALRDAEGKITGIVRSADLVAFHRYASAVVVGQIERAESLPEVIAARERLPEVVGSLIDVAAKPRSIMRLLASVHDAATDRLLRLAMAELGPPPVRFAFVCMGSEGREEETLVTDQDNGIIYQNVEPDWEESIQKYFLSLGNLVCQWLDATGYRYCAGGVMARTPQWCASLKTWQERFVQWINASEPKDIMRFDMCFDFRCVYGAEELTHTLRQFVFQRLEERPEFLCHFANNTLAYKPPLGFFGKIMVRDAGENEKVLNAKDAMMPIVKFARIYTLRGKLPQTNTLERLDRMRRLDLLSPTGYDEIVLAYEYLAQLRLQHQIKSLQAGRHPDNNINPKTLTHIEEATLREALSQIATIQKRISYDFLGGSEVQ